MRILSSPLFELRPRRARDWLKSPSPEHIIAGSRGADVPGHFFNVVNDNGTIRFLDGQAGGVANLNDGYVKLYLLRTN